MPVVGAKTRTLRNLDLYIRKVHLMQNCDSETSLVESQPRQNRNRYVPDAADGPAFNRFIQTARESLSQIMNK